MRWLISLACLVGCLGTQNAEVFAQPAAEATAPAQAAAPIPLNPQETVLLDKAGERLILKGRVCLREGVLELLACLRGSKEHEAIFSIDTKAQMVHAGLLALGLEPGTPVRFVPEYKPATGPIIDIVVTWVDEEGKTVRYPAQHLVRNSVRRYWIETLEKTPADLTLNGSEDLRYDEKSREILWYGPMSDQQRDQTLKLSKDPDFQRAIRKIHAATQLKLLDAAWVFAGSHFDTDPDTGKKYYLAESGDLICVANFSSATIDLSIPSSAANDDLLYEAYTERIPAVGTPVTLELKPRKQAPPADNGAPQK